VYKDITVQDCNPNQVGTYQ